MLDRLCGGDRSAFDAIFRAHYAELVRLAAGMLRDVAVAEELVQDVMLELWRRRESLAVTDSLRAYLLQSTRNRALNQLRHLRVERLGEPRARGASSTPASALAELVETEIDVALQAAVAELPGRCRHVFELSRGQGLRYAEIAEVMGISVKTVEAQMGKALRILRERLANWLEDDAT